MKKFLILSFAFLLVFGGLAYAKNTDEQELVRAALYKDFAKVQKYINLGVDINTLETIKTKGGGTQNLTVLEAACTVTDINNNVDFKLVKYLIDNGADVTKGAPLAWGCASKPSTLKLLMEKGADINSKTYYGVTPLINATTSPESVYILLNAGVRDINARSNFGISALEVAKRQNNMEVVRMLIDAGAY